MPRIKPKVINALRYILNQDIRKATHVKRFLHIKSSKVFQLLINYTDMKKKRFTALNCISFLQYGIAIIISHSNFFFYSGIKILMNRTSKINNPFIIKFINALHIIESLPESYLGL